MKLTPDQMDPRNNLQLYRPDVVRNADVWTPKMIRQEYSRLRSIARKRLERLAVAEPDSYAYRANVGQYAPVKDLSPAEMRDLLPRLARFIAAKTGTVSGIRAQRQAAVKTLQERGYAFITRNNIRAYGDFMDAWRAKDTSHTYGSQLVYEAFVFTQEMGIAVDRIKDSFATWLASLDKLQKYVKKQNKRGHEVTSDDILQEYERLSISTNAKSTKQRKRKRKNDESKNS